MFLIPFICQEMSCSNNSTEEEESKALIHSEKEASNCDPCDQGTSSGPTHATNTIIHNEKQSYSRPLSEYKSKVKSTPRNHKATHSGQRIFSCDHCDYTTNGRNGKSNLAIHIQTHHTGEFPFACIICNFKGRRKFDLNNHMSTHSGEYKLSCSNCVYQTNLNRDLVKHMRIHTGEFPFCCKICDYKARQKINLDNHMSTHSGEYKHSCVDCEYVTNVKSNMVRHMRTHTE